MIVTDRPLRITVFKDVMIGAWRPVKKMEINELKPVLYSLLLSHILHYERILYEGPWSFEQHLVVINRLEIGVSPLSVSMDLIDFWIHIYDLPTIYWTKKMATKMGDYIGAYVKLDLNSFNGGWKECLRFKVRVDIT